ncbi:hypothetical protein [Bradyrhizobium sp. NAS80.1]|uniref:hypothetical protein n=1 Tax=Bradyrhizobium sp. NAS80.1 TaxID=1680159 RepID=UPI0011611A44|nr:hypothetical protein [Bradyrhizobium sp. NAS80.1]
MGKDASAIRSSLARAGYPTLNIENAIIAGVETPAVTRQAKARAACSNAAMHALLQDACSIGST